MGKRKKDLESPKGVCHLCFKQTSPVLSVKSIPEKGILQRKKLQLLKWNPKTICLHCCRIMRDHDNLINSAVLKVKKYRELKRQILSSKNKKDNEVLILATDCPSEISTRANHHERTCMSAGFGISSELQVTSKNVSYDTGLISKHATDNNSCKEYNTLYIKGKRKIKTVHSSPECTMKGLLQNVSNTATSGSSESHTITQEVESSLKKLTMVDASRKLMFPPNSGDENATYLPKRAKVPNDVQHKLTEILAPVVNVNEKQRQILQNSENNDCSSAKQIEMLCIDKSVVNNVIDNSVLAKDKWQYDCELRNCVVRLIDLEGKICGKQAGPIRENIDVPEQTESVKLNNSTNSEVLPKSKIKPRPKSKSKPRLKYKTKPRSKSKTEPRPKSKSRSNKVSLSGNPSSMPGYSEQVFEPMKTAIMDDQVVKNSNEIIEPNHDSKYPLKPRGCKVSKFKTKGNQQAISEIFKGPAIGTVSNSEQMVKQAKTKTSDSLVKSTNNEADKNNFELEHPIQLSETAEHTILKLKPVAKANQVSVFKSNTTDNILSTSKEIMPPVSALMTESKAMKSDHENKQTYVKKTVSQVNKLIDVHNNKESHSKETDGNDKNKPDLRKRDSNGGVTKNDHLHKNNIDTNKGKFGNNEIAFITGSQTYSINANGDIQSTETLSRTEIVHMKQNVDRHLMVDQFTRNNSVTRSPVGFTHDKVQMKQVTETEDLTLTHKTLAQSASILECSTLPSETTAPTLLSKTVISTLPSKTVVSTFPSKKMTSKIPNETMTSSSPNEPKASRPQIGIINPNVLFGNKPDEITVSCSSTHILKSLEVNSMNDSENNKSSEDTDSDCRRGNTQAAREIESFLSSHNVRSDLEEIEGRAAHLQVIQADLRQAGEYSNNVKEEFSFVDIKIEDEPDEPVILFETLPTESIAPNRFRRILPNGMRLYEDSGLVYAIGEEVETLNVVKTNKPSSSNLGQSNNMHLLNRNADIGINEAGSKCVRKKITANLEPVVHDTAQNMDFNNTPAVPGSSNVLIAPNVDGDNYNQNVGVISNIKTSPTRDISEVKTSVMDQPQDMQSNTPRNIPSKPAEKRYVNKIIYPESSGETFNILCLYCKSAFSSGHGYRIHRQKCRKEFNLLVN